MKIQEFDGVEYIKKADVEAIVRQRIEKISVRANEQQERADALQKSLESAEKRATTADLLGQQIAQLQTELDQQKTRYTRHQAISSHGFSDPDIVDMIEWSYDRAVKGQENPQSMVDWLASQVSEPEKAVAALRPHILSLTLQQAAQEATQPTAAAQEATQPTAAAPPGANAGVVTKPPGDTSLFDLTKDQTQYRANRDAIKSVFFNQRRHPRS